jgi:hypothetical protein
MRPAFLLFCLIASLTGCGGRLYPDSSKGLADRCAAIMTAAIPYADLDIGKRTSANKGISIITAHVEATRADHPNDPGMARDFAADCEFNDTVLVSFHLTGLVPGH